MIPRSDLMVGIAARMWRFCRDGTDGASRRTGSEATQVSGMAEAYEPRHSPIV
jgi:hypothetical protein